MTTKTNTLKKLRRRRALKRYLVTNHQNMLYMLAAGMVMGPAGFRGKHYSDLLSVYPGKIPLFYDKIKIPMDVLNHVTNERKYLLPCVATFDLNSLPDPVKTLSEKGDIREPRKTKRKRSDDIAILIPAPLPLTSLLSIHFRSSEDMQAFENAANDVSNVDLSLYSVKVQESLFSFGTKVNPQGQLFGDNGGDDSGGDTYPAFGQALGGVLAILYHAANRSDLGVAAYRVVTGAAHGKDHDLIQNDPILAELPNWVGGGEMSGQADVRARLFWGVIQELVAEQGQERPRTPIDVTFEFLENFDWRQDVKFRSRLEQLTADMRSFGGLGDGTITELLERHKGVLSRSLLLFCLREHCTDLLEFSHPLLDDAECLLAGILFGVRDSWLQLPKELRNPEMVDYVSFRMADAEWRKRGRKPSEDKMFMQEPPRPEPLRELFTPLLRRLGQWPPMDPKLEADMRKKLVRLQKIEEKENRKGSS